MARPLWHVLAALAPVSLALRRDGPAPALAAAFGAVLVDGDHVLDWYLNGGREDYSRRIVVPLHGWEYPLLLLLVCRASSLPAALRRTLAALAAGWAGHLLLDWLVNRPETPLGYSLLNRAAHRFARGPSGWLPPAEWHRTHGTVRRAAPLESALAAALATILYASYER